MLPSALMFKMLALLPADHQACFFLCGAFLKHLPPDIRAHLVHDSTTDPLSLALHTNRIYQSRVSSASTMNYVSSNPEECPVPPVRAPPASPPRSQSSPTPGPPPAVHRLHLQPPTVLTYLPSAGIMGTMPTRHRSVVHCVPGWETDLPAGRYILPTCRFY